MGRLLLKTDSYDSCYFYFPVLLTFTVFHCNKCNCLHVGLMVEPACSIVFCIGLMHWQLSQKAIKSNLMF